MPSSFWLVLLCLVEGSLWLLPLGQTSLAVLSGLGGLSSGVLWIGSGLLQARREIPTIGEGPRSSLAWVAAGAIALPATLLSLAQPLVGGTTGATLLAGTPVVAVCAVHLLTAQSEDLGQSLMPAIAGLAGALLVLPFHLPEHRSAWLGFTLDLLAVVCAGVFGAWGSRLARLQSPTVSFRQIACGNAPALLIGSLVLWGAHRGDPIATDPMTGTGVLLLVTTSLVSLGLTFWCLGRLAAVSFASRFLLIPLIMAVESWAVWRPALSVREIAGALLLAVSVAFASRTRAPLPSTILPRTDG